MSSLDLARLQFGSTSIYHFLFVPVSIGLAFLVALLQTGWYRNGDETYLRLARFFGTLLLINVAIGVVTGLIQEFEFGMNWSEYSKLVGQRVRRSAGLRGPGCLLLGVHLPRPVDLRLEPLVQAGPSGLHLDGGVRHRALGRLHHGGQLLDADTRSATSSTAPASPCSPTSSPCSPTRCSSGASPTSCWPPWSQGPSSCSGSPPGSCASTRRRAFRRTAVISLVLLVLTTPLNLFVGSELGVIEGTYQPDEDRSGRGPVEHMPLALLLLRRPDRRWQQRRDPDPDHQHPRPALHSRH